MYFRKSELERAPAPLACFADNGAHLRAEIDWLHHVIRGEIRIADHRGGAVCDEFAGLYVSREEIEHYLEPAAATDAGVAADSIRLLRDDIAARRAVLDRRAELSLAAGVDLRLDRLARTFALDEAGRGSVLCCLAAEIDPQVSRLVAFLQNDATKRRPTFGLLARLMAGRAGDPVATRALFGPHGALCRHRLIEPPGDAAAVPFPLVEARLAPGIADFLIGSDRLPPMLADFAEFVTTRAALGDVAYYRPHRAIVAQLVRRRREAGNIPPTYVGGPDGAGAALIAEVLANAGGKGVLRGDGGRLAGAAGEIAVVGHMLAREARLRDCVVLLQDADAMLREGEASKPTALDALLGALGGCELIATGTMLPAELRHRIRAALLGFELGYPTLGQRIEIWEQMLPSAAARRLAGEIASLAAKFCFTPGQIARAIAGSEACGDAGITGADLHARCRAEAEHGLHLFCQKIVPRYGWDDIVLPVDTRAQLQEICRWVKHRSQVHERWGFASKLAYGRGLAIMLSGASGTGKTMSAEIIARDLQLDLFRVDLSRVVSKYIGETEKNLSRIFSHSGSGSCVLFFDEADALLGKRTEVKDAHDRYANIEIGYLLAEMDRYEGVIIVATNMKGNIDPAFTRRFSHAVEYPLPDERLREVIWRKAFPKEAPIGADVDFAFLAQRFNIPGGSIKNIALASAFLAAADGEKITMEHVICATKREYQKIGRVCSKSDFGQYYVFVRETAGS